MSEPGKNGISDMILVVIKPSTTTMAETGTPNPLNNAYSVNASAAITSN
jgi:hypothetical protein